MFCAPAKPIPPQRAAPTNRRRESITNVRATIIFSVFLSISFELLLPKICIKKACMDKMLTAYSGRVLKLWNRKHGTRFDWAHLDRAKNRSTANQS